MRVARCSHLCGCRRRAEYGQPGPPSMGQRGPRGMRAGSGGTRGVRAAPHSPCRLLVLAQAGGGELCGRTTGAKALFCFTAEIMFTGEKEKTPVGVEALVPDGRVMEEAPSGGLAGMTAGTDPLSPVTPRGPGFASPRPLGFEDIPGLVLSGGDTSGLALGAEGTPGLLCSFGDTPRLVHGPGDALGLALGFGDT